MDILSASVLNQAERAVNEAMKARSEAEKALTTKITPDRIEDGVLPLEKLDMSSDAKKIKLSNLSAEVIGAMTGDTEIGTTPQDGSVTEEKLSADVISKLPKSFNDDDFAYIITDENDRVAFGITKEGHLVAKVKNDSVVAGDTLAQALNTLLTTIRGLDAGNIPMTSGTSDEKIADVLSSLAGGLPEELSSDSGYVYAITDMEDRLAFGITLTGKIFVNLDPRSIAAGSIAESKLDSKFVRKIDKATTDINNQNDISSVDPDGWRSVQGQLYFATSIHGHAWVGLPKMNTKIVKGINTSGADLIFRKRTGLNIRGIQYRGAYDPKSTAVESKTYKGEIELATVFPPATGTFVEGDYYRYITNAVRVINGESYNYGDLIVYDGSVWKRQMLPYAPTVAAEGGDWWTISNGGYFEGIKYEANERIYYVGTQANASLRRRRFIKGTSLNGEYYYRGEFNPASGLPAAPIDGDIHIASATGTAGGLTFNVDDVLVRESGVWGRIPAPESVAVPNGLFVALPCAQSSGEWEVRRADKINTRVTVKLNVYRQHARRFQQSNSLVMWGDSMIGTFHKTGVMKPFTDAGLTYTINTFGGGTSSHVLEMMQYEILVNGDRYKDRIHIFWHGQNNSNEAFFPTVPQMLDLMAPVQSNRFVLMSVLGERLATSFNGTRLVFNTQESMHAKTPGSRNDIIEYYKSTYPDNWFNTRQKLLDAADSTPCLDFPGMTERQVADTYGIIPLSHFFDYTTVSWKPSDLTFKGWRNTAGLPTGGVHLDYYVRSGGGSRLGNLIVNQNGTWFEHAHDVTHESLAGATVLANELKKYLDSKGW